MHTWPACTNSLYVYTKISMVGTLEPAAVKKSFNTWGANHYKIDLAQKLYY